MKIDAHQHFWQFNQQTHSWINDQMKVIKKDFLPDDLLEHLQENQIDGCVAVQADQSDKETEFLIALASNHWIIKGVVGWIDLQLSSVKLEERLENLSQFNQLKGFRHIVQDEPDDAFMLQKSFKDGIGLLAKHNFTYDILIYPRQLSSAIELASTFPQQSFVLDHMAKPSIRTGEIDMWKKGVEELSKHENVYCKVSGIVTEADWNNWKYDQFIPYLDVIFESFGTKRIMFGSDWPVCLLSASYQKVGGIIHEYINRLSETEQSEIMGQNAINFYHLKI